MIYTLTYDKAEKELDEIARILKELAAYASEESWHMEKISVLKQMISYLDTCPLIDMMFYDVTEGEAIEYLQRIRKDYKESQLMLIADSRMSPVKYLRPGIMASSLILRPFNWEQVREALSEFIQAYLESRDERSKNQFMVVISKEETLNIPYSQIYFFEAREKKVCVCTCQEEFSFYSTIDRLEKELPEQFIRCHRGFIVNSEKIRKISFSQNEILLADDFAVPLSRSYKSLLRGWGK